MERRITKTKHKKINPQQRLKLMTEKLERIRGHVSKDVLKRFETQISELEQEVAEDKKKRRERKNKMKKKELEMEKRKKKEQKKKGSKNARVKSGDEKYESGKKVWITCPNKTCGVMKHRYRKCALCGEPAEKVENGIEEKK